MTKKQITVQIDVEGLSDYKLEILLQSLENRISKLVRALGGTGRVQANESTVDETRKYVSLICSKAALHELHADHIWEHSILGVLHCCGYGDG